MRFADRKGDLFLVSPPVGQLVDRKHLSAFNENSVPLLDAVTF